MDAITVKDGLSQGFIIAIIQDSRGFIWVGTKDGLNRYDGYGLRVFTMRPFEPWALRSPEISSLLEDDQHRFIWVGTDTGLWLFDPVSERFYELRENGINLPQKRVNSLSSDDKGNFMVSYSTGELYHLRVSAEYAEKTRQLGKPDAANFQSFLIDAAPARINYMPMVDRLQDGSFFYVAPSGSFFTYDPQTQKRQNYLEKNLQPYQSASDGIIRGKKYNYLFRLKKTDGSDSILPPSNWAFVFNLNDRRIAIWPFSNISIAERFTYNNLTATDGRELRSNDIAQDAQGTLWIGTNKGLIEVPDGANSVRQFICHTYDPKNPKSISSNWITHILPDPRLPQILWIGTRGGGLNRFDKTTREFSFITEGPESLPDNVVYGILPDEMGNLWCSTNHGICRYAPQDKTFTVYREAEGLLSTEFNTASFLKGQDGYFWFGGVNGLNAFRPSEIQVAEAAPSVYITEISVLGVQVLPDVNNRLKLKSDQNNLTIHFAISDFRNTNGNRYHYRLNGGEWIPLGNAHSATFSALPPGEYLLEVEGATADSPWSKESARLYLQIEPPWYNAWPAWLLYAALLVAAITIFIRYRLQLFKIEHSAELNRQESERLKSFDEVKNRFFADVAHEVRSPLTIVRGLSERLLRSENTEEVAENARLIMHQSENLLELSNQLLDLARLDSRQLKLMRYHGDFQAFIEQQVAGFVPLAADKGVLLHFESAEGHLWMDFDPFQFKKILNNLLSNAIRHTDHAGKITVSLERLPALNSLELKVSDTGEGIAPAALPHVFERYHQGENPRRKGAAGIGLALSAELVKLMDGQISVNSILNQGSSFKILLPIVQADSAPIQEEFHSAAAVSGNPGFKAAVTQDKRMDLPLLLLIEDNENILTYLQSFLSRYYQIKTAKDGISGIRAALQYIPDLIITDITMPGKNGYEVTETLKADERSSHIPIVMLSARTEAEDRLEGYRRKANAYLSKPFSEQELLLILQNLLELRDQLREKYTSLLQNGKVLTQAPANQEDAFLQKTYTIFEQNFHDDTFKLPQLCRALAISSSQLDRKLNALTEQSPMEMLRQFRLAKAQEMLQSRQPRPSVQEVCYACGFKSPEHFSRLFSDTYGISPSEV